MKKNIFLIGVGRSGTTLLQSMLHAHSNIFFGPETHFVKRYLNKEIKKKGYNREEARVELEKISKDSNYAFYENSLNSVIERVLNSNHSNYYLSDFYTELLSSKEDVEFIGDKDPLNMNYLSTIKLAFPDAKIIQIIRDPRDVIASRMKSGWGSGHSLLWHASEYKFSFIKARSLGGKLFSKNYYEIRYEELLLNTKEELGRLCQFLNIEFEATMLNHFEHASRIIRDDELQWKSNVLKPVDPGKIGKWKTDLTMGQIKKIEGVLSDVMPFLGYEKVSKSSFIENIFSKIQSGIILLMFKVKFG